MKLEETFGSAGFRRVVLPGIVLTIGLHPLLSTWLGRAGGPYGIGPTVLLLTEVIFFGLVVSSGIQWIYYVYEGFRLPRLTAVAAPINQRTVEKLEEKWRTVQQGMDFGDLSENQKQTISRIYEYLSDFPLRRTATGSTERYVERPTRLGNIIATYELYAETRYGVDGTYYWQHFLDLAQDSTRKQFEEQYVFAESLVLTSFSGAIVAVLHILLLVGFWIGSTWGAIVTLNSGPIASLLLATFGIGTWLLFYKAALPAHREAGAALRAIVDNVMPKFADWIDNARAPLPETMKAKMDRLTEYLKDLQEVPPKAGGPEEGQVGAE